MAGVVRGLADTSGLVVVDNCEHVVEAAAAAVMALLEGCSRLRVLATSREALRVPAETAWPLGPLESDDAVRLFVDRAGSARPDALAGAQGPVEEICARLEGLPLALELAAARVSALSPATILSRLQGRLDVLSGQARGIAARHRSLRATIEWSFELLTAEEQAGFARLSVFPGSFSLRAAEAVAGVDLDMLSGLVAKSLVSVVPASGEELRYRLLDALRSYARERLAGSEEEDDLRERHLRHFVDEAEAAYDPRTVDGSEAEVRALSDELDNLRTALAWSVDHDSHAGLRLVGATRPVWFLRSQTEGMAWTTRLLELHPAADRARALGLVAAGQLAVAHQDHAVGRRRLADAAELAERLGEADVVAVARHYLGVSAMLSRDLDAAERELTRSLELFEGLGGAQGVGRALGILGTVRFLRGDPNGAREVLAEALAILEACNDPWGQGQAHLYLGLTAKSFGHRATALRHLSAAVAALTRIGDVTILGVALAVLATLTTGEDPRRALRLAGAAVGSRERVGGQFPPGTLDDLDTVRQAGADALGTDAAQAEWEAGRQLDPAGLADLVAGRRRRDALDELTARQLEIARLVGDGQTNAQIARRLQLSERTVENHVFNALARLGLRNRVQLATWVTQRTGPSTD